MSEMMQMENSTSAMLPEKAKKKMKAKRKSMGKKKQKGFTLLELLVVAAIIVILAAIAIPKFLQARNASSESAAAGTMRTLGTALSAYQAKWNTFPATASLMGGTCNATTPPTAALGCTINNQIANAIGTTPINGYNFTYTQVGTGAGYTLTAAPAPGNAATRQYYSDESLSITYSDTAVPTATSPLLGN